MIIKNIPISGKQLKQDEREVPLLEKEAEFGSSASS